MIVDSLGVMNIWVKYRSAFIRALLAAGLFFALQACSSKHALVLVDPVLGSLNPKAVTAFRGFRLVHWSVQALELPFHDPDGFILAAIEKAKPSLILASPLIIADLLANADPGLRIATVGIGEEINVDDPRMTIAYFESRAAYRALGALMAMIVTEYDRSHPDKSRCGVMFSEANGRPRAWMDEFTEGFAGIASLSTLSAHLVVAESSVSSISPGEEEMDAVARLESLNLSAFLAVPGSRFLKYSGLFPKAIVVSDEGEPEGMVDIAQITASPGSRTPHLSAALDRNHESAVLAIGSAVSSDFSGKLPIPLALAVTKPGNDFKIAGLGLGELFAQSLAKNKAIQDTGFRGN